MPEVRCSVVVPVYRSRATLEELVVRLTKTMDARGGSYELVLVNDGSPDGSWTELERLAAAHPHVVAIDLTRNFGQHHALLCGFAHARGEVVVTLDDDLQHPPEEIPVLLDALETSGADAVIGTYARKKHGPLRNLGTWGIKKITNRALDLPPDLDLTSFRALRRPIVDALLGIRVPAPRIGLMLVDVTRSVVNVQVRHEDRKEGRSGYTLRKLVGTALDDVLHYSSLPLRMASTLGFGIAVVSVLIAVFYVVKYLTGGIGVSGFTTIVLLTSFFGGTILLTLGVVGEYLIRILRASETKPLYVVREKQGG